MTQEYYYTVNGNPRYIQKHDNSALVYINKEHNYQDSFQEDLAMKLLSSDAFVVHCYFASKPPMLLWEISSDNFTMGRERLNKAFNELISLGYIEPIVVTLHDKFGEEVEVNMYQFNEKRVPVKSATEKDPDFV